MSYTIPKEPGKEADNATEDFLKGVCDRRDEFFDGIFQYIAKASKKALWRRCVVEVLPYELLAQFTWKYKKTTVFGTVEGVARKVSEEVYGNAVPLPEEDAVKFVHDRTEEGIFFNAKYTHTIITYDPYYKKLIDDAKKDGIEISFGLERVTSSATGDSRYELAVWVRW